MENIETLSNIIDNFYVKNKTEKVLSILNEIRSGRYYSSSNKRKYLINTYKNLILDLSINDYKIIKKNILNYIPSLINERNSRKIAYTTLSQIIEYSCGFNNLEIYYEYEKEIIRLANINKEKYLYHVITLAQTRERMFSNIENVENFFIRRYLPISRTKSINYKYLIDFTMNVKNVDTKKFLIYLFKCKPFRNDFIIKNFISQHNDLGKLTTLL